MSHTPGPWVIMPDFKTAINAGRKHVAMVNFNNTAVNRVAGEEHEANARLISAAPDMFEALKNASGFLDTPISRRRNAGDSFYEETVNSIRAALTKAQGLSPERGCRQTAFSELHADGEEA